MKNLIIIFFILTVTCSFGQTQADMTNKAYAAYQKADKELNQVYKQILVRYKSDLEFIKNLKASQRIWINFREAELNMKYPKRKVGYYGSIHPTCRANYLAILTRQRTTKLGEWLKGAEEGDTCAGSIQMK